MLVCLVFPGMASADSGSITNVYPVGSQLSATYTTTSTCAGEPERPTDCGWWPHAVQGPASQPCREYVVGDGRLTHVGEFWIGPNAETTTDTFYPDHNPVRICLYVSYGSTHPRVLVAEYVYPPTPTTTPTTPTTPVESEPAYVPMALISEQAGPRAQRASRRVWRPIRPIHADSRMLAPQLAEGPRSAWPGPRPSVLGDGTVWYDDEDAADDYTTFSYQTSIKRQRIGGSTRGSSSAQSPASPSCNPNYSGACLPLSGDVDSGKYSARNLRSVGSDPFRLDGDGDGIACESYAAPEGRGPTGAAAAAAATWQQQHRAGHRRDCPRRRVHRRDHGQRRRDQHARPGSVSGQG